MLVLSVSTPYLELDPHACAFQEHSLHCYSIGVPNQSLIFVSHLTVPVIGTQLSTSPEVIHMRRPYFIKVRYNQQLDLSSITYFQTTSSLEGQNLVQSKWSFWMFIWLKKYLIPQGLFIINLFNLIFVSVVGISLMQKMNFSDNFQNQDYGSFGNRIIVSTSKKIISLFHSSYQKLIILKFVLNSMNTKQLVVGVSRTLEDIGSSAQWNKKLLTWLITHNTPNSTRQHRIELQMTLISSQRVVRVDGQVKHRAMVSFGFKVQFGISNSLKGMIEQDGFSFELFVNGRSFTELAKVQYGYQPPRLEIDSFYPKPQKNDFKPPEIKREPVMTKPQIVQKPIQKIQTKAYEFKPSQAQKKKSVEETLKDSQDELLRIMIEQKRKKKLNQQKTN